MPDSQEWLSLNENIRFPLAEVGVEEFNYAEDLGHNEWLRGFILDIKLFLSPHESQDVYLQSILYQVDTSYTLTFGDTESGDSLTEIEFPIETSPGTSDVGMKRTGFDGAKVVILVPGPNWDDPTTLPAGLSPGVTYHLDGDIASTEVRRRSSAIHPQLTLSGPKAIYQIQIDDEVDPAEQSHLSIIAGNNISLSEDDDGYLVIDLVPGAGDGLNACDEEGCLPVIQTINGINADGSGNIGLDTHDCLRQASPLDEFDAPEENEIKLFSDCLPCCSCRDYGNVSWAISRQSAKLRDINLETNWMMAESQENYNEAVQAINDRSPGLVAIYSIETRFNEVVIKIMNTAGLPVYAALSLEIPAGSDIVVKPGQDNVESGIQLTEPPLKNLTVTEQNSGIVSPGDVTGWRDLGTTITVGGAGFEPIQPAEIVEVSFHSPSATEILDTLTAICPTLQSALGGSSGSDVLDADATYQALVAELDALSLIDADCLNGTTHSEDDDRYRCQVQSYADSIRRGELRDQILARKYELAFTVDICDTSALTAAMSNAISRLNGIGAMVGSTCKDGSFDCSGNTCTSDAYGDTCISNVRAQSVERQKIYADIDTVLRLQVEYVNELLEDCITGPGAIENFFDENLDTSITAIYGDLNFGCSANNKNFEVAMPTAGDDYTCLDQITALYSG